MKNKILIIISIFIILLSVGCGSSISVTVNNDSGVFSTYADTETEPIKKNEKLDIHTVEKRENELVFNFSIDDLIDNYNGYYHCDKGSDFLSPSGEWNSRMLDKGIHSLRESTLYAFSVDPKSWALPTMWVFVTPEDGFVQEITLNFDRHSYSENLYDLFNEICFYTLKVMFPELSDDAITQLYTKVNVQGYNDPFPAEKRYGNGSLPHVLYYGDGIGVYPYFALGSYQRLCIIPITEVTLNEFRQKGVEIYEISN